MVYAGWCSKNITALLQAEGCNAIGLTGADANVIKASRRASVFVESLGHDIDYGYVGDVNADSVNARFIYSLLEKGIVPVFNAINHDGEGNLLNTNADTIASETAKALSAKFDTTLVYCFEKKGVLYNPDDDDSVISEITPEIYENYKAEGIISGGMIPKLDNAFRALEAGVSKVVITEASQIGKNSGTTIQL